MTHVATPSAHTPSPWYVDRQSPYSPICIKPHPGRIVCDIENADAESEANARLIAAAPDMLQRLKDLYLDLKGAKELMLGGTESDSWMVTDDGWNAIIHATEKVIAKAVGCAICGKSDCLCGKCMYNHDHEAAPHLCESHN